MTNKASRAPMGSGTLVGLTVVGLLAVTGVAGISSIKTKTASLEKQSNALPFQTPGYVPGYVPGYIPGFVPGYGVPGYVPGYGFFQTLKAPEFNKLKAIFQKKKK